MILTGVGGTVLFLSSVVYFVIMLATVFSKQTAETEVPFAEAVHGPGEASPVLERWGVWVPVAIGLVLLAYGPPLVILLANTSFQSPGFMVW